MRIVALTLAQNAYVDENVTEHGHTFVPGENCERIDGHPTGGAVITVRGRPVFLSPGVAYTAVLEDDDRERKRGR